MPLSLQPLDDRHLPGMEEIVADPEALRFTRIPEPAPPGFAATWLARYQGQERVGFAKGHALFEPVIVCFGDPLGGANGKPETENEKAEQESQGHRD